MDALTANVKLWFDNDQAMSSSLQAEVAYAVKHSTFPRTHIADWMQCIYNYEIEKISSPSLRDFATVAVRQVQWRDIANLYWDEYCTEHTE